MSAPKIPYPPSPAEVPEGLTDYPDSFTRKQNQLLAGLFVFLIFYIATIILCAMVGVWCHRDVRQMAGREGHLDLHIDHRVRVPREGVLQAPPDEQGNADRDHRRGSAGAVRVHPPPLRRTRFAGAEQGLRRGRHHDGCDVAYIAGQPLRRAEARFGYRAGARQQYEPERIQSRARSRIRALLPSGADEQLHADRPGDHLGHGAR